jgi:hypothetical protein
MKTREFCGAVAKKIGVPQEDVFRIFLACIAHGKELMAHGDEWRLPGLGKLYCTKLPPRKMNSEGRMVRNLDAVPRTQVKCRFGVFKSALPAVGDEDEASE